MRLTSILSFLAFSLVLAGPAMADNLCIKKNAKVVQSGSSLKAKVGAALSVKSEDCAANELLVTTSEAFAPPAAAGGIAGYEIVSADESLFVATVSIGGTTIDCPSGKVVIGGGCVVDSADSDAPFFDLLGGGGPLDNNTWTCQMRNASGSNRNLDITISAICANQ